MGVNFWAWWVIIVLSLLNCLGCLKEERMALLQLKDSINFPYTYGDSLPSWVDNETATDCCRWEQVQCNNTTRRVIELSLNYTRNRNLGDWHFNASLFLPFLELKSLFLMGNNLIVVDEARGFGELSKLKNLENLDLSWNSFNITALPTLNGISSLESLNLQGSFQEYGSLNATLKLKNLEVLDMSFNSLNRSILFSLSRLSSLKYLDLSSSFRPDGHEAGRLSGLSRLEVLYFRDNKIDYDVMSILNLTDFISLKELHLSNNRFQSLGKIYGLKNLKVLNLRSNKFNSSSLSSLERILSLESLDLSGNDIRGSYKLNELHFLPNLVKLDLRYNYEAKLFMNSKEARHFSRLEELYLDCQPILKELIDFDDYYSVALKLGYYSAVDANFLQNIGAVSSLKVLSLSKCGLNGTLPNKGWCELKNLDVLDLSGNNYAGVLPPCLENLKSLQLLDLSDNKLTGNIALSPLTKLTSLRYLSISKNHFQVPNSFFSFYNHSNLRVLIAGSNEVIAESDQLRNNWIPNFQLEVFNLSNCKGLEILPKFLRYQSNLNMLDLSQNSIQGDFPTWLLENNTKLEVLHLRENALHGPLLLPSRKISHTKVLDVAKNELSGQIPNNLSSVFPNLVTLLMSGNLLDGCISSTLGELISLKFLDLSNNNLSCGLPEEIFTGCVELQILRLSNNKLQGQIFPDSVNELDLEFLYLDGNEFSGAIPDSLSSFSLQVLDISNNFISGRISESLGNMSEVKYLAMSNNQLEGPIPTEFCKLDEIILLDLSENKLSSSIPSCFSPSSILHVYLNNNHFQGQLSSAFSNSSSLLTLDLRENKFTGSIPQWIGKLPKLSTLLLRGNHLEGTIPDQLCQMQNLSLLDISYNSLFGQIPRCLGKIMVEVTEDKFSTSGGPVSNSIIFYGGPEVSNIYKLIPLYFSPDRKDFLTESIQVRAAFTTKRNSYSYKGSILNSMTGIDLSCNKLSGEIPQEFGELVRIRALNLSHNHLSGRIPATFSNLSYIESLDLSYNNLTGSIPNDLVELHFLQKFSVAFNNLTGMTPAQKDQFATFEEDSYEGNPFLCGQPTLQKCTRPGSEPGSSEDTGDKESGFIDMEVFYIAFAVTYASMVLCIVLVLYINPHWRRAMFDFIEYYIVYCIVKFRTI